MILSCIGAKGYNHYVNIAFYDPSDLALKARGLSHYFVMKDTPTNFAHMLSLVVVVRSYAWSPDPETHRKGVAVLDPSQIHERKLGVIGLKSGHAGLYHGGQTSDVHHLTTLLPIAAREGYDCTCDV